MEKTLFPPQAYLTASEAANRWLPTPSLDRVPRAKYILSTPEREAAPDMLEAAQLVMDGLNERISDASDRGHPIPVFAGIAALHAAIAKAKGGAE